MLIHYGAARVRYATGTRASGTLDHLYAMVFYGTYFTSAATERYPVLKEMIGCWI